MGEGGDMQHFRNKNDLISSIACILYCFVNNFTLYCSRYKQFLKFSLHYRSFISLCIKLIQHSEFFEQEICPRIFYDAC